jgi:hypothetical protein
MSKKATMVVALLCLGLGLAACGGVDRSAYLDKNERMLAELPRFPDSHLIGRQVLSDTKTLFGEQFEHTVGYTTYVTYAVPDSTTQQAVVDFYQRRLHGWRGESWTVSNVLFACFERDSATIAVFTEGIEPHVRRKSYGLSINHKGGGCD